MSAQSRDAQAQLLLNARRLRAGVLLTMIGAALGLVGSVVAGAELAIAVRKWLSDSGYPPSEMARMKMRQALTASQAATHAAVDAWQHSTDGVGVGAGAAGTRPS